MVNNIWRSVRDVDGLFPYIYPQSQGSILRGVFLSCEHNVHRMNKSDWCLRSKRSRTVEGSVQGMAGFRFANARWWHGDLWIMMHH